MQLLSVIPQNYKIGIEGLDDENKYFHPFIKVEDDIIIKGQGDIETDYIYAWELEVQQTLEPYMHTISFTIEDLGELNKVLANWNIYKDKVKQYLEVCKTINENINMLQEIKTSIEANLLSDLWLKDSRKECLDKLFTVKEWIENERIIENYSGKVI